MNKKNCTLHFTFGVIKVLLITVQLSSKVMQKLLQLIISGICYKEFCRYLVSSLSIEK